MLAIAISLLFGLAAFAAVTVIHASAVRGSRRAREILAELALIEPARPVRITPASRFRERELAPLFAAA